MKTIARIIFALLVSLLITAASASTAWAASSCPAEPQSQIASDPVFPTGPPRP